VRRLIAALRRAGVLDGAWTLTASLGSKLQTLVLLAVGGALGGVQQLGVLILAVSTGVLLSSLIDLGFSTQTMRAYAAGELTYRRTFVLPFVRRAALLVPVSVVVSVLVLADSAADTIPVWVLSLCVYAVSYFCSSVITRLAYGAGRFRSGSTLNGLVRSSTIPVFLLIGAWGAPAWTLLLALALGESIIAVLQFRFVPDRIDLVGATTGGEGAGDDGPLHTPRHENDDPAVLSLRRTWRYGVGPVANTVMNRSDTVLVSFFASATTVGVYGLASQLENALTTVALIPAGAAVAYAARARSAAAARNQRVVVTTVVSLAYIVIASPLFVFPSEIVRLLFSVDLDDATALRLCIVAGLFSCLGGVATQLITGMGRPDLVMVVWISTACVGIAAFAIGASTAGAIGAAGAALIRDVTFFSLAWLLLLTAAHQKRKEEGE
jgi:O-antigen/teichoic acid export membrane protein